MVSMVKAHVPDHDPIVTLQCTMTSMKLGLDFDQARTNSAMTQVMVLSANVGRIEW